MSSTWKSRTFICFLLEKSLFFMQNMYLSILYLSIVRIARFEKLWLVKTRSSTNQEFKKPVHAGHPWLSFHRNSKLPFQFQVSCQTITSYGRRTPALRYMQDRERVMEELNCFLYFHNGRQRFDPLCDGLGTGGRVFWHYGLGPGGRVDRHYGSGELALMETKI